MSGNNNKNNKMAIVRASTDSAPAPHDNRFQLVSAPPVQNTTNNAKVNNTTKNGEEVKVETPNSNNEDRAVIHICHWHGDCYVNFPSASPLQSLAAAASSLHQNQQHRY